VVGYYANKNLGLSTKETARVNLIPSKPIYHPSYYTGDNVAAQAQAESSHSRPFRWEELGIDLTDLEALADRI
jgi:hypothetical protein